MEATQTLGEGVPVPTPPNCMRGTCKSLREETDVRGRHAEQKGKTPGAVWRHLVGGEPGPGPCRKQMRGERLG
jgi:hypothetical protein